MSNYGYKYKSYDEKRAANQTIMKSVMIPLLLFLVSVAFPQTYVSGAVSGVWDSTGSPFYVTDSVCVPTGDSLRIGPGVEVIFQGRYKFCVDSAAILKAIGTAEDSIIFTAEDTVLTDSTGGWNGLIFTDRTSAGSITYCHFEYANDFAVVIGYSSPYISNCLIRSSENGIYARRNEPETYTPASHTLIGNSIITDIDNTGIFVSSSYFAQILGVDNTIISNCNIGLWGSNVSIENCIIENNIGAGSRCGHGKYFFRNCTIRNNGGDAIRGDGTMGNIYNCIIENNGGYAVYENGCMHSYGMNIFGNTIRNNGGGINIPYTENTVEIKDNIISGNLGDGVDVFTYCTWPEDSLIITGNNIHSNTGRGLVGEVAYDGWAGLLQGAIKIVNNLVFDNCSDTCVAITYRETLHVEIEFVNNTVENIIIHRNPEDIWGGWATNVTAYIFNNAFIGSGYSSGITAYLSNNYSFGASSFVDPSSGNYHLTNHSRYIDIAIEHFVVGADTFYAPSIDIEGTPRPNGSGFDIGAYEYLFAFYDSTFYPQSGWNLISVPTDDPAYFMEFIAHLAGPIYEYDSTGYRETSIITPGKGYWVPVDSAFSFTKSGSDIDSVLVHLRVEWNLIGTCGHPIYVIYHPIFFTDIGPYYGFDSASGVYYRTDHLYPGNGYWVLSKLDTTLVLGP